MEHIAIDLGGRESQICVRAVDGSILDERKWMTRELERYLARRPLSRVVLETCAEAFRVGDTAIALGHEVRVVPASLVRSLGVGSRGTKTDRRDAQILSDVSTKIDLPSVHIPSLPSRDLRARCTAREALTGARTQLINSVRGWARTVALAIRSGDADTFARRARAAGTLPPYIEALVSSIEQLTVQLKQADQELASEAEKHPVCVRMMTVPGVGPVTAVRVFAAIDDPSRFTSAHKLEAYFGLTPGEDSSSQRIRRTSITKAGSPAVRRALGQAAWCARRCAKNHPMVLWANEVEKRRGKKIAMVALSRKLVGILFAIWRDGSVYNPLHASQA